MADEQGDEQLALSGVWMRGGTSKALFLRREQLPADRAALDRLLKRLMGTPDPLQIDGLGGARLSTSKVAIVSRSSRPDADVDYHFVQVDVERDAVDHGLNCGNISSAVGPYAIDEGLVAAIEPVTTVRIWNTNTDSLLSARVPVRNGKARVRGECSLGGVPGTGAEILMDYAGTIGSRTGALLPTGRPVDEVETSGGRHIPVTYCDAANPCVFVDAASLGLAGTESPQRIAGDATLMAVIHELRGRAGQRLGFWNDWRAEPLPAIPMLVIVSAPQDSLLIDGRRLAAGEVDLCARLIFLQHCHTSLAGTGAICLAAAARVPGSVVQRLLPVDTGEELRIGHPSGVMPVKAVVTASCDASLEFVALGFARTARRLMDGRVYVPTEEP